MRSKAEEQKKILRFVLREYKNGKLKSGGGRKVSNPKQAIAIALKAAGESKYATKTENRRNLNRTKHKIRAGKSK